MASLQVVLLTDCPFAAGSSTVSCRPPSSFIMAGSMELQSLCSSSSGNHETPPFSASHPLPSAVKASSACVLEFTDLVYSVKPNGGAAAGSPSCTASAAAARPGGCSHSWARLALAKPPWCLVFAGDEVSMSVYHRRVLLFHMAACLCLSGNPRARFECNVLQCAQLDVLSANASGGHLQGTITLNGLPRRPAEYRKLCCYVMQRDVLLESATVRS